MRGGFAALVSKLLSKILCLETLPILSVGAIIEQDGKLLSLDLSYLKGYCLPGGIVQAGENIQMALEREVREETGLTVLSAQYLWSISSSTHGISTLLLVFTVDVCGDLEESEEGTLHWLDPREMKGKMAYLNNEKALEIYLLTRLIISRK